MSELPNSATQLSADALRNASAHAPADSWRISSFSGILLSAYFIPTWTIVALRIMVSPIQGLYERPNISIALFISDHLQLAAITTVRLAWLLALGKLTVVAFFSVFMIFMTRESIRKSGDCDEPLAMAIVIAGLISFISMLMASRVGETLALRLHSTELLLLLGTAIVMLAERSVKTERGQEVGAGIASNGVAARDFSLSGS